jgi:hypothetical protein
MLLFVDYVLLEPNVIKMLVSVPHPPTAGTHARGRRLVLDPFN